MQFTETCPALNPKCHSHIPDRFNGKDASTGNPPSLNMSRLISMTCDTIGCL